MAPTTVENINIEVHTNAGEATRRFRDLANALDRLGNASYSITRLSDAMSTLTYSTRFGGGQALRRIERLSRALAALGSLNAENFNGLDTVVTQLGESLQQFPEEAIARLERIAAAANRLNGLNLRGLGFRVNQGENANNTARNMNRVANATHHANGRLATFISSLRRIALYRLIRTVLREITQAFQEGLQNAYLFSATLTTESRRFATAMDNLTSAGTKMKAQLGSAFIALITAIEPILTWLIDLLVKAADAVSQFFAAFTGSRYLKAADVSAKFADNMKKGAGAAKEWKNQLLGFDEINRLNDTKGSGGVSASEMFGGTDTPIDSKWLEIVREIKDFFSGLNFQPMLSAWDDLSGAVSDFVGVVKKGLGWVWENILQPLAEWTIEEAAPRVVELLAKALEFLTAVFEKLAPIFEYVWNEFLKPFFEWLGDLVLDGLDQLIELLTDLTDLINGDISWQEFADGLTVFKVAVLALGSIAVLSGIGRLVSRLALIPGTVSSITTRAVSGLGRMARYVGLGAFAVADAVLAAYDIVQIHEAAKAYNTALKTHNEETRKALDTYAALYRDKGKEVADEWASMVYQIDTTNMSFDEAQNALAQKVETYWDDVPQNMWQGFKAGWDEYFGQNGKGLFALLGDAFTGAVNWVKGILGINSPSTVFYDIGVDMFQGLLNGMQAMWSKVTKWVEESWSGLTTKWNNFWSGLSNNTPATGNLGLVKESYGNVIKDLRHIDGLAAEGGVFPNTGSLFIAGEAGPEIVANMGSSTGVMNVEQMRNAIFEAMTAALAGQSNSGANNVHVYLDSREIKYGQTRLARATGV